MPTDRHFSLNRLVVSRQRLNCALQSYSDGHMPADLEGMTRRLIDDAAVYAYETHADDARVQECIRRLKNIDSAESVAGVGRRIESVVVRAERALRITDGLFEALSTADQCANRRNALIHCWQSYLDEQRAESNHGNGALSMSAPAGYTFSDPATAQSAYDAIKRAADPRGLQPVYGRFGYPETWKAEGLLAAHHEARWCVLFPSAMAAIDAALWALQEQTGFERITLHNQDYPGVRSYLQKVLATRAGYGIRILDADDLRDERQCNTVMLTESLSSATVSPFDFSLSSPDVLLLADNTLATWLRCRPLARGAQLVVESLGKFVAGGRGLMLGALFGNSEELGRKVREHQRTVGSIAAPCIVQALRGRLATFPERFSAQCRNARALADHIRRRHDQCRVHYPFNGGGAAWWAPYSSYGASPILTLELDRQVVSDEAYLTFIRSLSPEVHYRTSMGAERPTVFDVTPYREDLEQVRLLRINPGTAPVGRTIVAFDRAFRRLREAAVSSRTAPARPPTHERIHIR